MASALPYADGCRAAIAAGRRAVPVAVPAGLPLGWHDCTDAMLRNYALASLGLLTVAVAQTPINMPPFVQTYVAHATRGFYFTAPVDCVITGLEAPNEGGQTNQVVEVLDFGLIAPLSFPSTTSPVAQLFYDNSVAAGSTVNCSVALVAGRIYGIFGCCTDSPGSANTFTSYGNGPFATDMLGNQVTLRRLIVQSGIASNGGNQPCSVSTGRIGRVLVDIEPAGLVAGFHVDVSAGPAPLTVNFTDASVSDDPGGVTSWAWDFENDGTVDSTVQNPSHTFTTCGDFDVALTVTDASNPPDSELIAASVRTDVTTAAFSVSQLASPNVWQFTDTSNLTPTSWAWDFENDGTVDSTLQNPTYTTAGSCLDTTVSLTVMRNCQSSLLVQRTFLAGNVFLGETNGGNGLTSPTSVGNYFDIDVTATPGLTVCGLALAPYLLIGPCFVNVYVTEDTHAGKEGQAAAWRLVSTGSAISLGGGLAPPTLMNVAMDTPFYLPVGSYGIAVFLNSPGGMGIAYTDGPAGPYVGADLTIHPNAVGTSSDSELGPVAFSPRLWNGGFHYTLCGAGVEAAAGFFGTGCPGALGTPQLDAGVTAPALGTTYQLDVTNVPGGLAVMMSGLSPTFSPVFGALPVEGTPHGAPGCWLRTSADSTEVLLTGTTTASWSFAIPNDPTFVCLPFFNQAGVLSIGTNPVGFVLSDARAAVVGH